MTSQMHSQSTNSRIMFYDSGMLFSSMQHIKDLYMVMCPSRRRTWFKIQELVTEVSHLHHPRECSWESTLMNATVRKHDLAEGKIKLCNIFSNNFGWPSGKILLEFPLLGWKEPLAIKSKASSQAGQFSDSFGKCILPSCCSNPWFCSFAGFIFQRRKASFMRCLSRAIFNKRYCCFLGILNDPAGRWSG